jgi:CheY-like chemotaxis protein
VNAAGTILLVEDDSTDVLLLRRAFEKAGVTNPLEVVSDGEQAVAYLSGQGDHGDRSRYPLPSLVLLDIMLPRRSGFEVLTWMRQDPALRRLPVIMLTSSGQPGDISRAYDAGANAYHVKPSGFEELLEFVEALKAYWLTWTEPLAGIPKRRTAKKGGDDDSIFPPVTDLTNQVVSAKSKVYALLSRHPDGLTPEELARAFMSRGLAAGEVEVVTERIEEILRHLEGGPSHRKVTRTDDGRYQAAAFW